MQLSLFCRLILFLACGKIAPLNSMYVMIYCPRGEIINYKYIKLSCVFAVLLSINLFHKWRLLHGNEASMLFSQSILVSNYQTDMI